jgi:hypothetical protein
MPNFQASCASGVYPGCFLRGAESDARITVKSTRSLDQWSVSQAKLLAKDTLWVSGSIYILPCTETAASACPSIYHEFEGPEAIPYDVEGNWYPLLPRMLIQTIFGRH